MISALRWTRICAGVYNGHDNLNGLVYRIEHRGPTWTVTGLRPGFRDLGGFLTLKAAKAAAVEAWRVA